MGEARLLAEPARARSSRGHGANLRRLLFNGCVALLALHALACGGASEDSRDASAAADGAPVAHDGGSDAAASLDAQAPDAGDCPPGPEAPLVSRLPIPGESPAGWHELTSANGFQDDYLYDASGYLKIGTRREWGGSIVFFGIAEGYGPGVNGTNAIDANDTGREVQVAFYDPDRIMQNCAWNASCASSPTECPGSITFLGWNPVQGGNRCNVGSGVESVNFAGGALAVATQPLFWNPNWDRTDCESAACSDPVLASRRSDVRVTQTMRFVATHVVQLEYAIENLADVAHAATSQEMPTVYTANGNGGPDLYRVLDSEGQEIVVDTPGNDGFFYENFSSPGGWVTLQDEGLTYGVGIYYENRLTSFQAWQLRSLPFNNVRALFPFGIPALGTVRARAYLMLGSYATIASQAAWLDAALAPFGHLDTPAVDAYLSGTVAVQGWALDNRGVTSIELLVDGASHGPLSYGASRPDVCLVWPGYPSCDHVGFTGSLDTNALAPCGHVLEVRATDTHGTARVIAARRIYVDP